jgi:hypothetical protein
MRLLRASATVASSAALLLGLGAAPAAASDDLGETTVTTATGIVRALTDEDLELRATGRAEVEKSDGRLKVSGGRVALELTDVAADALNDALDTDLFGEGLEFGIATVSLED